MKFFLGAYWSNRSQPVEECAAALSATLSGLAACDARFGHWFEKGWSRKSALTKEVTPDELADVVKRLRRGARYTDIPRRPMPELGYFVSYWNGAANLADQAEMSCACAATGAPNSLLVRFPKEPGGLADVQHAMKALSVVVGAWDPEWAGVMSRPAMSELKFIAATPFVDWIVYVRGRRAKNCPPGFHLAPLANGDALGLFQDYPGHDAPGYAPVVEAARQCLGL